MPQKQLLAVIDVLEKQETQNATCIIRLEGDVIWMHHPYDPHLVEVDRSITGRRFDQTKKCSYAPFVNFPQVLNKYLKEGFSFDQTFLTGIRQFLNTNTDFQDWRVADIYDQVMKKQEQKNRIAPADKFRKLNDYDVSRLGLPSTFKPYIHQRLGIGFLLESQTGVLGDEMGLGKTMQVVVAVDILLKRGDITKVLVVCPNALKLNWQYEIERFSAIKPDKITVVEGTPKKRQVLIENSEQWLVINYEAVRIELDHLVSAFGDQPFVMICDESHKIKSPTAKQSKACLALGQHAARKFLLTGTLVANKPEDVWHQIWFLDAGQTLGDWREFRKQYCIEQDFKFGRRHVRKIVGYKNLETLRNQLQHVMLRRTKSECLDLPDKIYQTIPVQMTTGQTDLYKKVCQGILKSVKGKGEKVFQLNDILSKMLYALEVASNPALIDPEAIVARLEDQTEQEKSNSKKKATDERLNFWKGLKPLDSEASGKLKTLDELLESYIEENKQKVVLWSFFVKNIELFGQRYQQFNPVQFYGQVGKSDRLEAVRKFQEDDSVKLFIGNPQAAGVGLTLTAASIAIFFDRNFSTVDFAQAADRIHRIGQSQTCHIITLQSEKTIDQYVDVLIKKKQRVAAFLHDENPPGPDDGHLADDIAEDAENEIDLNQLAKYLHIDD